MKKIAGIAAFLLLLPSCREKPTALPETTFFTFFRSGPGEICETDSTAAPAENRGSVLLLPNNKALYALKNADTIHYYRGTYRLADNSLQCTFDSKYGMARKPGRKTSRNSKTGPGIVPVKTWTVTLQKTGCGEYAYYSETPEPDRSDAETKRMVYRDADTEKVFEYMQRINNMEALVDFHMEPPAQMVSRRYIAGEAVAAVESHYRKQNTRANLKRTESDSAVKLSFSYKKRPKGEPPGPYLHVSISKLRSHALTGDMNRDTVDDVVVMPTLSQGGGSKWKDLFVFVKTGDDLKLKTQASCFDLAQYKPNSHSGAFHAREIRDGAIYGTSVCYRDEDPQCCPSVKVPTRVLLENDRLKGTKVN